MSESENQIIEKAIEFVKEFFKNDFTGHDYAHTKRVYQIALKIARAEKADEYIVGLAALLHDVDDYKLSNTSRNKDNAKNFLRTNNVTETTIKKIIKIIDQVSFKGNNSVIPDSIEGKCVQDADRLDAIGAIGIARCFSYGGSNQREMYNPEILPCLNLGEREYYNHKSTTLNHFYEKLLLLKDMMNTDTAKELAQKRHTFMQKFLEEFLYEWNEKIKKEILQLFTK